MLKFLQRSGLASIRWKIVAVTLALVLAPMCFLNWYAIRSFDRFTARAREDEMVSLAWIVGEQYKSMVLGGDSPVANGRAEEYARLLRSYGQRVDARMRIVSPQGIILFDSDPDDPTVGQDFSERREIRKALDGVYDADWRLTEDGRYVFYYVPLPVRDAAGKVAAVAYVSAHTGRITLAILKMARDQKLMLGAALLAAFAVSIVVAQTLTRRLRRLTRGAADFARGDAAFDVRVGGLDEIGELGDAVGRMAGEIEKRNRYNRDFISAVVHELKMPLTAIKGAAEVLDQGAAEKPEARAKFLSNIRFEVDRMIRMVWELTELTKLDVEVLRGQKQEVDYGRCVAEIVERVEKGFEAEHAELRLVPPEKEIRAAIVPGRIEQVVFNLLENAFRYTPLTGSVEVIVRDNGDGTVVTTVRDNGCGISAANIGKVFDRYFTTEPKDKPREHGSGLGLAIAKSIVENHQGKIWVESAPGKGAAFSFALPCM